MMLTTSLIFVDSATAFGDDVFISSGWNSLKLKVVKIVCCPETEKKIFNTSEVFAFFPSQFFDVKSKLTGKRKTRASTSEQLIKFLSLLHWFSDDAPGPPVLGAVSGQISHQS